MYQTLLKKTTIILGKHHQGSERRRLVRLCWGPATVVYSRPWWLFHNGVVAGASVLLLTDNEYTGQVRVMEVSASSPVRQQYYFGWDAVCGTIIYVTASGNGLDACITVSRLETGGAATSIHVGANAPGA